MAEGGQVYLNCSLQMKNKTINVVLSNQYISWEVIDSSYEICRIPFNEVVAVHPEKPKNKIKCQKQGVEPQELQCFPTSSNAFTIHYIQRVRKHRWRARSVHFQCPDEHTCVQWIDSIQNKLNSLLERPKKLLIFINPFGGKKRAPRIYQSKVVPLFQMASIETQVVITERANHAKDLLQEVPLKEVDGVICVGGDGMFSEILNGLLLRIQKEAGININSLRAELVRPNFRIGIIPAGSTDAVVYGTTGINDPVTSALHIIIGDSIGVDVSAIHGEQTFLRFCTSLLAYGYFGDVLVDSERYRWMGPKRYDWSGFKKFIVNRSYEGEVLFRICEDPANEPNAISQCKSGCTVCKTAQLRLIDGEKLTNNFISGDWKSIKGKFIGINTATISCMCGLSPKGLSPSAHLGDGCTDLILVEDVGRFNYMRYLFRTALSTNDPFQLSYVQVYRVKEFKFRPLGTEEVDHHLGSDPSPMHLNNPLQSPTSVWNCDGEVISETSIHVRVHCQLIKLFARGVEDLPQSPFCSSCLNTER